MLVDVYSRLARLTGGLRLIIAPRHVERAAAVERIIRQRGYRPVRLSERKDPLSTPGTVFLLDTIGELRYFYSIADICFVGGSFASCGGQNILEPIHFSKPTLFGPHMENFRDIKELVLRKRVAIKVRSVGRLETQLRRLINENEYRSVVAGRCREVFEEENVDGSGHLELVARSLHGG